MAFIDPDEYERQRKNEENTKKDLITPLLQQRWGDTGDLMLMEFYFTDGRISVDEYGGAHRGEQKKADYLLFMYRNFPLAVVEAKGQDHPADEGYGQAVQYAEILDVPFAYATNGHELIEFDRLTGYTKPMQLGDFPTKHELWDRYKRETHLGEKAEGAFTYPYYVTPTGKKPRYYQRIIINRVTRGLLDGRRRMMVVAATGTGKTFTAFQLIWRFIKSGAAKRVLFLADRNNLIDQTMAQDFAPFEDMMVKFDNSKADTHHNLYLGIYQQFVTTNAKGETQQHYKRYDPDFFDVIIVDECHRSSANSESNWHEILEYFSSATQIGLTATPKNDDEPANSNYAYFGEPVYTYSLKQGIEDGFLAPYKVVVPQLDIDETGYTPEPGTLDVNGDPVELRTYTQREFDRPNGIIVDDRRELVAKRVAEYMRTNDMRFGKTIVFCETQEHAHEMARLIGNENADLMAENPEYAVTITADTGDIGEAQLERFITNKEKYPVVACTSQKLSTGVDAKTCELIVLDRSIGSMTEFKQIIGRGTRVVPEYTVDGEKKSKMYFTILDFRSNYKMFNDPGFDGDPTDIVTVPPDKPIPKPPIRPTHTPPELPGGESKTVRVQGVDVEITGEIVRYLNEDGSLVTQNITTCTRNNIQGSYPDLETFRQAWLLTKAKRLMASELLLERDWQDSFVKRFGYVVDDFDIICAIGYDAEPPMSREHRSRLAPVERFIESFEPEKGGLVRLLADAYGSQGFEPLRDASIFSLPQFKEAGWTPLKAMRALGGKQGYRELLDELENVLYQE